MKTGAHKRPKPINPETIFMVKQFLLGFTFFAVIAALIVGVWYGTRLESLTISNIKVEASETIDEEAVRLLVKEALEGTYLGLIPKKFTFFYPKQELLEAINRVPRIKEVEVSLLSNNELGISFSEYQPEALWCDVKDKEKCFFLDETGYAFAEAPRLSGGIFVRYYSLATDLVIGTRPFSAEDYSATKYFMGWLAGTGWFVSALEIDIVRDVFYTLTPSGEVRSTLTNDLEKQFNFLQTLRQSKEFSHLTPGEFQYVDLRFGTKVFVNEQELEVVTSSEVVEENEISTSSNDSGTIALPE